MAEKLVVPRLRVRRDWHKGLSPDPINRSPDVGMLRDAQDGSLANTTLGASASAGGSETGGAAAHHGRRLLLAAADAGDSWGAAGGTGRRLLQVPPRRASGQHHLGGLAKAASATALPHGALLTELARAVLRPARTARECSAVLQERPVRLPINTLSTRRRRGMPEAAPALAPAAAGGALRSGVSRTTAGRPWAQRCRARSGRSWAAGRPMRRPRSGM